MTFVGKILVVFQLVLSICFMAFAGAVYTAQSNWKKTAETAQADLSKARNEAKLKEDKLSQSLAAVTAERDQEKTRAEGAETQRDNVMRDLTMQKKANETLETDLGSKQAQVQIASTEAAERLEEAKLQRAENKTLHESRSELLTKTRELQDQNFVHQVTLKTLNEKHERTLQRMVLLERLLQQNGIDIDPNSIATKEPPPTTVEGKVLSTKKGERDATEFIEVSIGSDDDIRKGHELFVFRNSGEAKYLGKIRIVFVTPDKAVGTVIQKAKNGTIQKGDTVASKL